MFLMDDKMEVENMLLFAFLAFIFLVGSIVELVIGAGLMLMSIKKNNSQ